MTQSPFTGKRVLITSADRYFAPPIVELFREKGAEVLADTSDYTQDPSLPDKIVAQAGDIDIFIPVFAGPKRMFPIPNLLRAVTETTDADLQDLLEELVWPMTRFMRAVLPGMYARGAGKVVAVTSASPLRAIEGAAAYSGARAYQNAFVQAAGAEAIKHGVNVNAVGPAFLENNAYLPREIMDNPEAIQPLIDTIPAGRVGQGREVAELVASLAGPASDFMVGQVVPLAGGWAT